MVVAGALVVHGKRIEQLAGFGRRMLQVVITDVEIADGVAGNNKLNRLIQIVFIPLAAGEVHIVGAGAATGVTEGCLRQEGAVGTRCAASSATTGVDADVRSHVIAQE